LDSSVSSEFANGKAIGPILDLPEEKFFIEADKIGNLGSASIWVALHHLRTSRQLEEDDTILRCWVQKPQNISMAASFTDMLRTMCSGAPIG
jgi:3-oxoacyl-[acyl-carrier-protein] synthase III